MAAFGFRRSARRLQAGGMLAARRFLNRHPRVKQAVRRSLRLVPSVLQRSALGDVPYEAYRDAVALDAASLEALRHETAGWAGRPLVSVLVAVYDPPPEFLRLCVGSVLAQAYDRWELCLVDDASPDPATWELLTALARDDERIRVGRRATNGGISAATNDALAMAAGDYCCLLDHDDVLAPEALAELVRVIRADPGTDVVYSDEDRVTADGRRHLAPHFKPDFSPDQLFGVNLVTHLACLRTSVLRDVGGFDPACDGAQDWDLFLRVAAVTDRIRHVPRVLYSWRLHDRSTAADMTSKPYAIAAQRRAVEKALAAAGEGATVEQDPTWPAYWRVRHPVVGTPLVSIVIPSKDSLAVVRRCVDSVLARSTYTRFEIVLVDTGSSDPAVWEWYAETARTDDRFRLEHWSGSPFSYADSCNTGAAQSRGEILVMLNNDTEVVSPDWLETLVAEAQRPRVGAVGCLLLYPGADTVQHAGISLGVGDAVAVNTLSGAPVAAPLSIAQHMQLYVRRNVSAVTAACLAIRREVWEEMGGFDTELRVTYNDVDLCCRLGAAGYRIVYTPYATLLHHEGVSVRRLTDDDRDLAEFRQARSLFASRWAGLMERDPYRNPAFAGSGPRFALTLPARGA